MNFIETKDEQEAAEREIKNKLETRKNDLKKVLQTPEGRRFFWSVLCECKVYELPPMNTEAVFFYEGKRSIGVSLIARLNQVDPELYFEIAKENYNG